MDQNDLLQPEQVCTLLHASACSFLARRHGFAPLPLPGAEAASLFWGDLPFEALLDDYQTEVARFFQLPQPDIFSNTGTLGHAATRITELRRSSGSGVVFHTSGSTGQAKPCIHTDYMLRREAESAAGLFGGIQRVVCTTSPFHSYGFVFGSLVPAVLGVENIYAPPLPTILESIVRQHDLLVGFPMLYSRIAFTPPENVHCLTSTAPCPPELFHHLRAGGFSDLTEVYGSSETGAIAYRKSASAPFALLSHWLRIDEEAVSRTVAMTGEASRFALPDFAEWTDHCHLVPRGRRDNAVQVAGENVFPERVRHILLTHPLVGECAVRLMRPEEGERLKAFVVLKSGEKNDRLTCQDIRRFARIRCSTVERPGAFTFGTSLPRNSMGKLTDW